MSDHRPINKNPLTMRLPLTAVVSILHRLSGIFVFLFIPVLLWIFDQSLQSNVQFDALKLQLSHLAFRLVIWLFLVAMAFHLLAGIRHMLMDIGIGESLKWGRLGAVFVFIGTILLFILIGIGLK